MHKVHFFEGNFLNSLSTSGDSCCLLLTFVNNLDPDQAQQNDGIDF